MLFEIQHFGKIIAADLHRGLADLLPCRGDLRAPFKKEDALLRLQEELARQSKPGQPGPQDHNVIVGIEAG
jgi:hypothetical protein